MENEIFFEGEKFISAATAGEFSGFTRDYIAKLARDGKLEARRVGKGWFVRESALKDMLARHAYDKELRRNDLAEVRRQEYHEPTIAADEASVAPTSAAAAVGAVAAPFKQAGERLANSATAKRIARHAPHAAPAGLLATLSDLGQKISALFMAFALTFGTYAFFDEQYAAFAHDTIVSMTETVRKAPARVVRAVQEPVWGTTQVAAAGSWFAGGASDLTAAAGSFGDDVVEGSQSLLQEAGDGLRSLWQRLRGGAADTVSNIFPQRGAATGDVSIEVVPYSSSSARTGTLSSEPLEPVVQQVTQTVVEQPIRERVIERERVVTQGGVSIELLTNSIQTLRGELLAAVNTASFSGSALATPAALQTFALSQRIDNLSGTSLSNVSVNGISGLTDGDIPDTLTASNYLALSGGTLTGTVTLSGALQDASGSAGTDGYILQSTGTSTQWVATSTLGIGGGGGSGTVGSGTTGQFAYYAADGAVLTATSSLFLMSTGNIGVGTTTPSEKLAVVDGTAPEILVYDSTNGRGAKFGVGDGFNATLDSVGGDTVVMANGTAYLTVGDSKSYFENGNLGLGTTSPTELLHVAGDARIEGALYDSNNSAGTSGYILQSNGTSGFNWVATSSVFTDTTLTQEQVEDYAGGMLTGNTETLISVTYQDADGTIDFVVDNDLANYDNSSSNFITLTDLSSTATGLTYTNTTGVFSLTSGYEIPLSASTTQWTNFYNTPSTRITAGTDLSWAGNTLNFDNTTGYITGNETITLSGDVTGSGTTSITTTIASDVVVFTDINYTNTLAGNPALGASESFFGTTGILFEGTTADTLEGLLTTADITGSDKTWTLPNTTGTIALLTSALTGTFDGNNFAGGAIGQGDILYGSAAGVISELPKDTNATRYLSNTGTSNNPAWAQINLANGVTGTLPVANGGTGATSLTGLLIGNGTSAFTATTTLSSSYIEDVFLRNDGDTGTGDYTITGTLGVTGTTTLATSGGNVGIGTASPNSGYKLNVSGGKVLIDGAVTPELTLSTNSNAGGSTYVTQFGGANATDGVVGGFIWGNFDGSWSLANVASIEARRGSGGAAESYLSFSTKTQAGSLTEKLRIAADGRVGIGTTSPDALLEISGDVAQHLRLYDEGEGKYWDFQVAGGGSDLILNHTDTAGVLRLEANGRVGIGVTPQNKLDVDGAVVIGDSYAATVEAPSNGLLVEGDVGIGTTTPGSKLDVQGNAEFGTGSEDAFLRSYNSTRSHNGWLKLYDTGTGGVEFGTTFASNLSLFTSSTERLTIDSSGRVGIGTTSPSSLLHLVGGADSGKIHVESSSGDSFITFEEGSENNFWSVGHYDSNNRFAITDTSDLTSGNQRFVILPTTGYVGIGTTTPGEQLVVADDSSPEILVYDSANGRGAKFGVGDGFNATVDSIGGETQLWANGSKYFTVGVGGGSAFSTGNVGIGTTSPGTHRLSVSGITSSNGYRALQGAPDNADNSTLGYAFGADGDTGLFSPGSGSGNGEVSIYANNSEAVQVTNQEVTFNGSGGACVINGSGACSSDERLKSVYGEEGGASALQKLGTLRAVTYNWADSSWDQDERIGVLAQDLLAVYPQLVGTATTTFNGVAGNYYTVNYGGLTAPLIAAVNELNSRTSFVESLYGTSTPRIIIAADGNIGIGTDFTTGSSTPAYDLEVRGDVAAQSFVNISTRDAKTNIAYLTQEDREAMLAAISTLPIAEYRYIDDKPDGKVRVGLIAEEAPASIQSEGGKGIDLYKFVTTIAGAVKALAEKVSALAERVTTNSNRIADLEAKVEQLESVLAAQTASAAGHESSGGSHEADGSGPTIQIRGNNPAQIEVGSTYNDLGATATNADGADLTVHMFVDGTEVTPPAGGVQLDTSTSTTYQITYRATDGAGNEAEATREVIVGNQQPEEEPIESDETVGVDESGQGGEDQQETSTPEIVDDASGAEEEENVGTHTATTTATTTLTD